MNRFFYIHLFLIFMFAESVGPSRLNAVITDCTISLKNMLPYSVRSSLKDMILFSRYRSIMKSKN